MKAYVATNEKQRLIMRLILVLITSLTAVVNAAEPYSPPLRQDYPNNLYWGDTHVHTYLSPDAYPLGSRVTPDEAYRFAKGETIVASGGDKVRLQRPLDFLMVSDHAENMGVMPRLAAGDPRLLKTEDGQRNFKLLSELPTLREMLKAKSLEEYQTRYMALATAKAAKGGDYGIDTDFRREVWEGVVAIAEKHNDPGKFTTFAGYEYSSAAPAMLHRNVVYVGGPTHTRAWLPFSSYDSKNPEDLWSHLERYRKESGSDVIAIPHNTNLSNGQQFKTVTYDGKPLTRDYASTKSSIEPIMEVTQFKGDSETHPLISPNDEFADFETLRKPKTEEMARQSYARGALKTGLEFTVKLGVNPYKLGMIGSTDTHQGLATADEDNLADPGPYRYSSRLQFSASGYAAVWARENTREAIFSAMKRREVYATTGPRITLRFFGGWDFESDDALGPHLAEIGYRNGVPMGGDLVQPGARREAPTFLLHAVKDPVGANLDRIQIIKGWRDTKGRLHEKIHDVAWSGDRSIGKDDKLPAVGSSVDVKTASYLNSIGSHSLSTTWTDPDFNSKEAAFYYVRVLQIPTPRWQTYDASFYNLKEISEPAVIQERAYSSPIWYTPQSMGSESMGSE